MGKKEERSGYSFVDLWKVRDKLSIENIRLGFRAAWFRNLRISFQSLSPM